MDWTQVDGVDVYGPTDNVIASPPIFTVPAGQSQIVRVGLIRPSARGAYRMLFAEIPGGSSPGGQVQITLSLNLPLYIIPKGRAVADLSWRAWSNPSGELIVEGSNRGSLHSQIIEIRANTAGKSTLASRKMGVILPRSARHWNLGKHDGLAAGSPLALTVRSPTAETRANVVLELR